MKTVLLNLVFVLGCVTLQAQIFPVETIFNNGSDFKRINIVLIGDGYTAAEQSVFISDAQAFTTTIFNQTPFKEYKNFFNVYAIKVPSNESGADHPGTATDVSEPVHPVLMVDTYFHSTFDAYGIHRLLTSNNSIVNQVVFDNVPAYDEIVVLVNTPHYGGSGGAIAVGSTHSSGAEIALHEIGHSFAKLRDEYWAGDSYAQEGLNLTQNTDPTSVRWSNWMGLNGVGIYQHSGSGQASSWYRPHSGCKMRYLGSAFCAVCKDAIIERIHFYVSPIASFLPDNTTTIEPTSYPINFSLNVIKPNPNTLNINWNLNGEAVAGNVELLQLNDTDFTAGINSITATVKDVSNLQKINNHDTIHVNTVTWTVNNTPLGLDIIDAVTATMTLKLYPNPATQSITVSLKAPKNENIALKVYAMDGRLITSQDFMANTPFVFPVDSIASGTYVFTLTTENGIQINKRVVIN